MRIFSNKAYQKELIAKAKELMSEELYRALYEYQLSTGIDLDVDTARKEYVSQGYEGNADVFGITNKIGMMFSNVKISCFNLGSETEVDNPLLEFFAKDGTSQTFGEYLHTWELFNLITGNGIDYIPAVDLGGNNKGKIQSINLVPPQNVDIESGGWREPIKAYKLDFNGQVALDKRFIYHVRMFPNLDYTNGKNFMGLSPVSVAANIIIAQNNGYLRLAQLLLKGAPPGILSKDTEGPFDPGQSDAQRVNMEKQWKRKYSNTENAFLPLFTTGKIAWQQIGISSMKDLQVLESSVAGMRVLCRIWGIPPQAFGDTEQSTYNNMNEAKKAVYEDRIMPDMTRRLEVFNKILGNDYYKKELRADYSEVPCMQTDLKTKAEILGMEKGQKTITVDEYREGMGRAPLDEDQRIELRVDEEPEENVLF